MTFYPKGAVYFAGFLAVLALTWSAKEGTLHPGFAVLGAIAIVLVDVVLTFWPAVIGRGRHDEA